MKNTRLGLSVLSLLSLGLGACGDDPKPPSVSSQTSEQPSERPSEPAAVVETPPPEPEPYAPDPRVLEALRSHDAEVRRDAEERLLDAGDPVAHRIRDAVSETRRKEDPAPLAAAVRESTDYSLDLIAHRLGYVSPVMRGRICAALGAARETEPAAALLLVHALIDADERVRAEARAATERISPALAELIAGPSSGSINWAGVQRTLAEVAGFPRIGAHLSQYLAVFSSRLGHSPGPSSMRLHLAAFGILKKDRVTAEDVSVVRSAWIEFRRASPDRESGGEGDAVLEALFLTPRDVVSERAIELLRSEEGRSLGLAAIARVGKGARGHSAEIQRALVAGAEPSLTLLAVRDIGLDVEPIANSLRQVVLDESQSLERRVGAVAQLCIIAPIGADAMSVVESWIASGSAIGDLCRALVRCRPTDRTRVESALIQVGQGRASRPLKKLARNSIRKLFRSDEERIGDPHREWRGGAALVHAVDRWAGVPDRDR